MSRLKILGTRLSAAPPSRIGTLTAKPGVAVRTRGRAGVNQRARAMKAAGYLCVECRAKGLIRLAEEVDHRIPLHAGGSDTDDNLDPLCADCHKAKTAAEASSRATGGVW